MSDPIFKITKAQREATPALIGLWGPSGSGKTKSALRIARGLVGPEGKIGFIDTENRRSKFYANDVGGWDHLDLQPPFSPDRYTAAFKEYETLGQHGCIIVDSMSHVWEGEGGVLDNADAQRTGSGRAMTGLAKWKAPKMAYKRMFNNLMRAPFHVIFCLRAKEGVRQVGGGDSAKIESIGLEPICEKNFIYEMTVSVLLGPDHFPLFNETARFKCSPAIPAIKAPGEIWGAVKPGQYLDENTGRMIAEWINGGGQVDLVLEKLKREAREAAAVGAAALKRYWDALDNEGKRTLKPFLDEFKGIAANADSEPVHDTDDPLSDETPNTQAAE